MCVHLCMFVCTTQVNKEQVRSSRVDLSALKKVPARYCLLQGFRRLSQYGSSPRVTHTHIHHSETTAISNSDLVVRLYRGPMKGMNGNSEPQCSLVVDRQWPPLLYVLLFKLS